MKNAKFLFILPSVFEAATVFAKLGYTQKLKVGSVATSDDGKIAALISGIGCARTKERIRKAVEQFKPEAVVLCGYCGACVAHAKNGEIIYETEAEHLKHIGKKLGGSEGRIATADHIVAAEEKRQMRENGYIAVEMEGELCKAAIREVHPDAHFAHFRWVSDTADCDIPTTFFESLIDLETGEWVGSKWTIAKQVIKSPTLFFKLAKMGKELAPAQRAYNDDVAKVFDILKTL